MPFDDLNAMISSARPRYRTAAAFVAEVLREAIVSGLVPESTPLRQDEIAERFQVSRTPVREALRLLESQGLVDFQPLKGAVVAALRTDELVEIFDTRAALEVLAIRRSIPRLTDAGLANAASALDELAELTDPAEAMRVHRRFHLALYAGAGNRLLQLVESQLDAAERYLRLESVALDNSAEDRDEHRALLQACRERDADRAATLLGPHIEDGGRALAEKLEAARRARADAGWKPRGASKR
ncbi:MAG: GntR family transcriptional regulator [Lautropia sp.]